MADIKAGDEVRVFDRTRGRGVTEYSGEVVKVGRTLVTIAYGSEKPYLREAKFHMDRGTIADKYGGVWFKTLEQAALDERAERADKVIRDAGFEPKLGRHPSPELVIAIAAAIEAFGQED